MKLFQRIRLKAFGLYSSLPNKRTMSFCKNFFCRQHPGEVNKNCKATNLAIKSFIHPLAASIRWAILF